VHTKRPCSSVFRNFFRESYFFVKLLRNGRRPQGNHHEGPVNRNADFSDNNRFLVIQSLKMCPCINTVLHCMSRGQLPSMLHENKCIIYKQPLIPD